MQSKAQAVWEGDLMSGKGKVSSRTSGGLRDAGLSWKSRTEAAGGNTTPEELLAASHASCFAMALSHGLAQAGTPPQKLDVTATVTFGPKQGGGFSVQESVLEVRGWPLASIISPAYRNPVKVMPSLAMPAMVG